MTAPHLWSGLRVAVLALATVAWGAACNKPAPPADDLLPSVAGADAGLPSQAALVATPPPAAVGPSAPVTPSNPLGLPARRLKLDAGSRVFTFSSEMLSQAKLGSTLVLYGATIVGFEGDDLIVEQKGVSSYKVHPGYVIPVPAAVKVRPGDPVLTEWSSAMRHAVVTRLVKDKVAVRLTDVETRTSEVQLKDARFIRQVDGLVPGNYAAALGVPDVRHVLLVSPVVDGDRKRWLALGFAGAVEIVDESDLRPIPVKWTPKVGAPVFAASVGLMRKATVMSVDPPAFFTVKYERAGRPATVAWGLVMPPLSDPPRSP